MASRHQIRPPPSSSKWKRWARELRKALEDFETFEETHPRRPDGTVPKLASDDRIRDAIWAFSHGEDDAMAGMRSYRLASLAWRAVVDPATADQVVRIAARLLGHASAPDGMLHRVRMAAKPGKRGPRTAPERLAKRVYNVLAEGAGELVATAPDSSETMRGELGRLIRLMAPDETTTANRIRRSE